MTKDDSMEVFGIRHSASEYKTYKKIYASENPQQPLSANNQEGGDLTEGGKELANKRAEEFFSHLNPKTDILFFASSDQFRAIETANIYLEIARDKGFEVIRSEHPRNDYAEEISGGDIRVINSLSLRANNALIQELFTPQPNHINWEAVPGDVRQRWLEARKIIELDNRGTWGANFFYHSAKIKELFPELQSAEDLYRVQFQHLLQLISFAKEKVRNTGRNKNVKILAFGHENYMAFALDKYLGHHEMKNCEAINISVENGEAVLKRVDQKRDMVK